MRYRNNTPRCCYCLFLSGRPQWYILLLSHSVCFILSHALFVLFTALLSARQTHPARIIYQYITAALFFLWRRHAPGDSALV
jgi:hypothetical protein